MPKKSNKKKPIKRNPVNKKSVSASKSNYTAKDIEVLEGLEPVRKRPGMYIGGTDTAALHHLVSEVLDNSMDEVVAGYADKVEIKLINSNTIEISDNGRGIPVDKHPKFKIPAAEVIMTTLHSGGKFSEGSYKTSGGLHGVGVSVVNALSINLTLEIARDKKFYIQTYSQGSPKSKLKAVSKNSIKKGTKITFTPDPEIFIENSDFNSLIIYEMAKAKAYLIPDVEIIWSCPKLLVQKNVPTNDTLHFSGGIKDYLKITTEKNDSIIEDNFYFNEKFNEDEFEAIINWYEYFEPISKSYCNTILTPLGGTHENGFKQGVYKAFKDYTKLKYEKKSNQINQDDLFGASASILSIFISNPEFQGQTKEKLVNTSTTKLVETAIKDRFETWLTKKRQTAEILFNYAYNRSQIRLQNKSNLNIEKQIKRKRIIFAKNGVVGTTTKSIANEAGVSEGLLFRHYQSKEGLVKALKKLAADKVRILAQEIIDLIYNLVKEEDEYDFYL